MDRYAKMASELRFCSEVYMCDDDLNLLTRALREAAAEAYEDAANKLDECLRVEFPDVEDLFRRRAALLRSPDAKGEGGNRRAGEKK